MQGLNMTWNITIIITTKTILLWSVFVFYYLLPPPPPSLLRTQTKPIVTGGTDFQMQMHCWWEQVGALCSTVSVEWSISAVWALWLVPNCRGRHNTYQQSYFQLLSLSPCLCTHTHTRTSCGQQVYDFKGHCEWINSTACPCVRTYCLCPEFVLVTLQCTHWAKPTARWLSPTESSLTQPAMTHSSRLRVSDLTHSVLRKRPSVDLMTGLRGNFQHLLLQPAFTDTAICSFKINHNNLVVE